MNQADEEALGVEVPEGSEMDDESRAPSMSMIQKTAIIVVILIIQAVSAHFIVKQVFFSTSPAEKARMVRADGKEPPGDVYSLSGIIVNPIGTSGSRHLLLDIGLETSNPKVLQELEQFEPQLRDNLITFLSAQRTEVLIDIQMREKIRVRVAEIVNHYLTKGQVERVYFIRYVFQ